MDEDGTAATGHTGALIVVDFYNKIIEIVIAAEPVTGFIDRPPEGPVVAPIVRVLAPGVVRADPTDRQRCPRPQPTIESPPQPYRPKSATRRAAIAFVLKGPDPGSSESDRQSQPAGEQPSL